MIDPNRPYSRLTIDLMFKKRKALMQQEALKRGDDDLALYTDCYTGETLRGGTVMIMNTFVLRRNCFCNS